MIVHTITNEKYTVIDQIGTVCDDYFNYTTAVVICREMGYQTALNWTSGYKWPIQNNYDIVLDNVKCNDTDNTFDSCRYSITTEDCGHSEDIFLNCAGTVKYLLEIRRLIQNCAQLR